jgi:glycosyltransferase involved in cell wall biosynthesis
MWGSLGLIAYAHAGYPLLLRGLLALGGRPGAPPRPGVASGRPGVAPGRPAVSLIIAAHDEADTIDRKLDDALSLDYAGTYEVIVASDGSTDGTAERARARAAADPRVRVLDLPRAGKVRAQDAAVEVAGGEVLAFSDANAIWEPGALTPLVEAFDDPRVGYACGELRLTAADGSNQEGTYWRYETIVRRMESRLCSITAGNGAIYAVRRSDYLRLDPRTSHDLSLPFNLVKRGRRAVVEPGAVARERPIGSNEGEFRRKRRMMSHAWPAVLAGGMLDPRGYGPAYALEVFSHRLLRYSTPFLHAVALGCALSLARRGGGRADRVALAGQLAIPAAAGLGRLTGRRWRALALCEYYLLVTASLAMGLWDWLNHGTPATWERAAGRE